MIRNRASYGFGARRPGWRTVRRLATLAAAFGLLVAGLAVGGAVPRAAAASPTLEQVSSFGANPGNLQMFDYVPVSAGSGVPLVVALHGCEQDAADYYDDSGWPKFADEWNFDLVFPQQPASNNALTCFDWYTASDDTRGHGEAASIVSMVQYMEATYAIDPSRVYVTGLSAGGGMTSDLLADYPDVFAGGSIDSGLPAQCATTALLSTSCQLGEVAYTPAAWGTLVRNSDPGYSGPYPRVAIWQGTADTVVSPLNAGYETEQWTNVWGLNATQPSSVESLPGGTTETDYDAPDGTPAIENFVISGMGHGLAVNPGSGATQCGALGEYFLDAICSSYYTAQFWGLDPS
jgi:poly(hydroxyalkanoate) depolymerase family esterase